MALNEGESGSVVGVVHDQSTGMDGVINNDEGVHDVGPEDVGNMSESVTSCNQLSATERDECLTPTSAVHNGMYCHSQRLEAPSVGMIFPTWEAADNYYRIYGKQQGFGVIRPSAGFSRVQTKRKINVLWKCERAGKPNIISKSRRKKNEQKDESQLGDDVGTEPIQVRTTKKSRKSKKCECPAMMYAGVNVDGEWVVRKVVLEHKNHSLTPGTRLHTSQLNQAMPKLLLVSQTHDERNGLNEKPNTELDMHNKNAGDKRLITLDEDSNAMMKFFEMMYMDNQNFYHSFRQDDTGKLHDVVWIDARCRAAYEEFGDVVWLDTTYMINDYDLPLATFVGVNHHGHTILFGCALISREDVETFEWVFSSWLVGMAGKAPGGILTDETDIISKALGRVMPGTTHKWCLWHVIEKISQRLGTQCKYIAMTTELKDIIYDSFTGDEFEERWKIVIDQYELADDTWLTRLYEERLMWVPIYNKDTFCAGMRNTQRVESMQSFFDDKLPNSLRNTVFLWKRGWSQRWLLMLIVQCMVWQQIFQSSKFSRNYTHTLNSWRFKRSAKGCCIVMVVESSSCQTAYYCTI
ncbi:protein FAR-RED IMPAIRED RESPONSE 1 [Spinacia oleracea]|uniref:Protein FAR-RED IMPAIRED RESPONSE 1 n=1 Tax=Spinacia oleracea TaxID=3562 RepID=A0A9R0JQ91_SPIOL|nr:protein FAR-RED IMPAIRED RESPONSE 1-like [Spinacia oleracea]